MRSVSMNVRMPVEAPMAWTQHAPTALANMPESRTPKPRSRAQMNPASHESPAPVASRTFLAWNGTELMCTAGHTLLHVPGLPTSWFSTQRWLYLDTSWEFLFTGSGVG